MLFVRPVERPPTHMQQRVAAPGPPIDLRTVEALRERAAANWEAVRKKVAADEKAALHERYRQEDIIACAGKGLGMYEPKFLSDPKSLTQMWAEFERTVSPDFPLVRAIEQRNEPRMVSYSNNIFDKSFNSSFLRGFRIFDAAQLATGAAVRTAVLEVD